MCSEKTHRPIVEPDELAVVQRQVAALIDGYGHLRREWLSQHSWIVTPVWGDYDDAPGLPQRAASVATQLGQQWFISSMPAGSTNSDASTGKPLPVCYRVPVSERALVDAAWEWVPSLEHVITTEDAQFAIANPEETLYLLSGPKPVVEQLLGCTIEQAWADFGTEDAPFFDNELDAIRSHLRLYIDFGTDVKKTIGTEPLEPD